MENKKAEKLLSVIVPVYNTERYLRECLDSIVAQSVEEIEVILVDDGSTDASGAICDEYAARYDFVEVVHGENHGQSYARRSGVIRAQGKYIGFVDSDDWIDADMYRQMLQCALENSLDMVCCGLVYEKNGRGMPRYNGTDPGVYDFEAIQREILPSALAYGTDYSKDRGIEPHLVDKLVRKRIINEVLFGIDEQIFWGEDALSVLKCIVLSQKIGVLESCFYHYRLREDSISVKNDVRAIGSYARLLNGLLDTAGGSELMCRQVRYYSVTALRDMLRIGFNVKSEKFWLFPFEDFDRGMSIALYGAGNVGRCYYGQLQEMGFFKRVDLFDTHPATEDVKGLDELKIENYDKIVISVDKEETALAIRRSLTTRSVPDAKIYWKKPRWVRDAFIFGF